MFRLQSIVMLVALGSPSLIAQDAESPVFSGPQKGEKLPGFTMKAVLGAEPGTDVDFVKGPAEAPVVVVFVHQLTRPGFALANAIMKYCGEVKDKQLRKGVCFLAQDPTQAKDQIERASRYFPKNTLVGYSMEGAEGPGAYGLNRNVQVTVLVGSNQKVVSNFALVQPGVHADGPKILKAIADVVGAAAPDINDYLPNNQAAQDTPIAVDPKLMAQVRQLNNEEADEAAVDRAIESIEALIKDSQPLQRQLSSIVSRWVKTKRIAQIGNAKQQEKIRKWVKPGMMRRDRPTDRGQRDTRLTALLRDLIQKTNTDSQVDSAAAAIEAYVKDNEAAKKEFQRITITVAYGGKLENYGTAYCQKQLKKWADEFRRQKD